MTSRLGAKNRSNRVGKGIERTPTMRSAAAWYACTHEIWNRWCRLKWAEISMEMVAPMVMATAPPTRATIADRNEDQSEAAWKSRR